MGTKTIKLNPEGGKTESELSPSDVDLGNVLNKAQVAQSDFTQDGGFLVGTGSGTYQEETGQTARESLGIKRWKSWMRGV